MLSSRVDVEWLAFRAGLKPAIRLSGGAAEAEAMEARYRARGAAVVRARRRMVGWGVGEDAVEVVYVAPHTAPAEALRDIEVRVLEGSGSEAENRAVMEEMGRMLGYPPCCCERFSARSVRVSAARRGGRRTPADAYLSARDAWVAEPRWQLNDLLLDRHARVITFEPCSYACPAALRYADAVLRLIAKESPRHRVEVERVLRRPLAVGAGGERAFVALRRGASGVAVSGALPVSDTDRAFAASLTGEAVAADGALGEGALVVAFGAWDRGA